jgi:site-specific recombinase XerD
MVASLIEVLMAYGRISLTKRAIDTLPLPESGKTAAFYMDASKSAPNGFGLWVTAGGAKNFMVYRKVNGRPERIKIGSCADLSVEQARKLAAKVNGQIAEGVNPAERKRAARGEITLGEVFREYLDRYAIPQGIKTVGAMRDDFARYLGELKDEPRKKHGRDKVKPAGAVNWERRKPSTITRTEVQKWHAAIAKSSGHYAANRALQLLRAFLNWSLKTHLLDRKRFENAENPAQEVPLFKERQRDRFIQTDELPRFFKAVAEESNETIRDFVLIALLTGARKNNVLEMKWEHVNLERETWRIPETKNGEAQTIPLTSEAIALLKLREEKKTNEWVFPADSKSEHLISPKKGWRRIVDRAGIKDLRLHDLRRTMGSWQAATGASLVVIGKSLGHKDVSTTAIYARLNIDPVRDSMRTATTAMFAAGGLAPQVPATGLKANDAKDLADKNLSQPHE